MTKHGYTGRGFDNKRHPLYVLWEGLRQRCNNPNARDYHNYGGRGITVSERWEGPNGFSHFAADMGERPDPRLTLDRIDNDGPYSPENCRWATRKQQRANQRPPKLYKLSAAQAREIHMRYEAGGLSQDELADEYGVSQTTIGLALRRAREGRLQD